MIDGYSNIILRAFHATPTTIVLRVMPSPRNIQNLYPAVGDVRTGIVYGPGQKEQAEYVTGTLTPGAGGGTTLIMVNE